MVIVLKMGETVIKCMLEHYLFGFNSVIVRYEMNMSMKRTVLLLNEIRQHRVLIWTLNYSENSTFTFFTR